MGLFKKNKNNTPFSNEANEQTLHKNLDFTASEQYRMLRTNLLFTLPADVKCPVIGLTSSVRGEGKSTTSINLSYVLAERNYKVLLIDADLRIPSIAKKLDIKSSPGLTDILLGAEVDYEDYRSTLHEKWYILPAGDIPPNPSELLGSKRMNRLLTSLREKFDFIIVDLPPVNLVTDAISISPFLTGMIVVVREEYATKRDLDQCFRQIELSNVKVLGYVMNESDMGGGSYSKYSKRKYRYYRKYYRYQSYNTQPEEEEN